MVALTYGDASVAPASNIATKTATSTVTAPRETFFARFIAAVKESRLRQAEREIRLYAPQMLPLQPLDENTPRGGW